MIGLARRGRTRYGGPESSGEPVRDCTADARLRTGVVGINPDRQPIEFRAEAAPIRTKPWGFPVATGSEPGQASFFAGPKNGAAGTEKLRSVLPAGASLQRMPGRGRLNTARSQACAETPFEAPFSVPAIRAGVVPEHPAPSAESPRPCKGGAGSTFPGRRLCACPTAGHRCGAARTGILPAVLLRAGCGSSSDSWALCNHLPGPNLVCGGFPWPGPGRRHCGVPAGGPLLSDRSAGA